MDFGFCLSPSSHVKMDTVDLTTFNRLKETNPDVNTCIACGSCTATCTAGNFTEMSFRRLLLMLQRGKEDEAKKMIQRCMLCGKCTLVKMPIEMPEQGIFRSMNMLIIMEI